MDLTTNHAQGWPRPPNFEVSASSAFESSGETAANGCYWLGQTLAVFAGMNDRSSWLRVIRQKVSDGRDGPEAAIFTKKARS